MGNRLVEPPICVRSHDGKRYDRRKPVHIVLAICFTEPEFVDLTPRSRIANLAQRLDGTLGVLETSPTGALSSW